MRPLTQVCTQVGTPICIPTQGNMELGRIASIELNHKGVDTARRGDSVALKLEATSAAESSRSYGRHFDHKARHCWLSCAIPYTCFAGLPDGSCACRTRW